MKKFPNLNVGDRLRLLGWANYSGHIFIYVPEKRKALMIINGEVWFIQKRRNHLYGIKRDTHKEMSFDGPIRISYFLNNAQILPLPEENDTINSWIKKTKLLDLVR